MGGTQLVYEADSDAVVYGTQFVYDTGIDKGSTVLQDGIQYVYGLEINAIIEFGGTQFVYGTDIASTILGSGARQYVYGIAVGTTIDNSQTVEAGSKAVDATINNLGINLGQYVSNAYQDINAGGVAIGTTVNLFGYQFVLNGAIAIDTTVNSGGNLVVAGGGDLKDATIIDGGNVNLLGTADTSDQIVFVGSGGNLTIGSPTGVFTAEIAGFVKGDTLEFGWVTFGQTTTLQFSPAVRSPLPTALRATASIW